MLGGHLSVVAELAERVRPPARPDPRRARGRPPRRRAPRRRQGRHPRRDPAQARPADRRTSGPSSAATPWPASASSPPPPPSAAVARLVRSSHERWDGAGYPDGLAGEAIPLGARIVAVADAFDAMTSGRPYRAAITHEEAARPSSSAARAPSSTRRSSPPSSPRPPSQAVPFVLSSERRRANSASRGGDISARAAYTVACDEGGIRCGGDLWSALLGGRWLWAGDARAGTYDVYGCRLPDGTPIAARGWTPVRLSRAGTTDERVPHPGGLTARDAQPVTTLRPDAMRHGSSTRRRTPNRGLQDLSVRARPMVSAIAARNIWSFTTRRSSTAGARRTRRSCACLCRWLPRVGDTERRRWPRRIATLERGFRSAGSSSPSSAFNVGGRSTVPADRPTRAYVALSRFADDAHRLASRRPSRVRRPARCWTPAPRRGPARPRRSRAEDRGGGIATVAVVVDGRDRRRAAGRPERHGLRRAVHGASPVPAGRRADRSTFDTTSIANGAHQIAARGDRCRRQSHDVRRPSRSRSATPGAANGARASRFARLDAWFETRGLAAPRRRRRSATVGRGRSSGGCVDEAGAPIT